MMVAKQFIAWNLSSDNLGRDANPANNIDR